jgi:hypothetical protein
VDFSRFVGPSHGHGRTLSVAPDGRGYASIRQSGGACFGGVTLRFQLETVEGNEAHGIVVSTTDPQTRVGSAIVLQLVGGGQINGPWGESWCSDSAPLGSCGA